DVQVIAGNAADLQRLLGQQSTQVKTIISGLPLRSLSKAVAETILAQISTILPSDGKYIQFTYHLTPTPLYAPAHYQQTYAKIIWRNLPPARVDVFIV